MDVCSIPQCITAIIATCALGLAYVSLQAQKTTARKRAAVDFFLKTETDNYMLTAWKEFEEAREAVRDSDDIAAFKKTAHWIPLRNYLNLHELIAVGVNQQVLDDSVCFDFWRGELNRAYRDCAKAIEYIQGCPDEKKTYSEVIALYSNWSKRKPISKGAFARRSPPRDTTAEVLQKHL